MTAAGGCDAGVPGQFEDPDGEVSQNLINRLAPLRRQWDLAVLANLAAGTERPGDLIEAINAQASDGRQIGWKVLTDTLRRLERSGYVARQEMPGAPRETVTGYARPGTARSPRSACSTPGTTTTSQAMTPGRAIRRAPGGEPGRRQQGRAPPPPAHSLTARDTPAQGPGAPCLSGPAGGCVTLRWPRRISRRCRRGRTSPTAR
jgi:DNA-binding HxlR family transcriptional regulator